MTVEIEIRTSVFICVHLWLTALFKFRSQRLSISDHQGVIGQRDVAGEVIAPPAALLDELGDFVDLAGE